MSSPETTIEPFYVVDTHALIWFLLSDKKLGRNAASVFDAAQQNQTRLLVSAIVVAELYYANAKNRWFPDFLALYAELMDKPYFRFLPVTHAHIADFVLDMAVPEMHDRIIVGVARRYKAPLVTSDPLIVASGLVKIVW